MLDGREYNEMPERAQASALARAVRRDLVAHIESRYVPRFRDVPIIPTGRLSRGGRRMVVIGT